MNLCIDDLRNSAAILEKELDGIRLKRDETLERIHENRYTNFSFLYF